MIQRGQRAALNLAGVRLEDVERGQELATPGYLTPTKVLTVRLHCLAGGRRPIKHRQPVRLHLGAAEIMATVALLDCNAVEPGGWGLGQLFLDDATTATWGQPFVLRESSATQTIGGGQVLQPTARKIRRRHQDVLDRVERLWSESVRERVLAVAWFAGFAGFTDAEIVRGAGVGSKGARGLIGDLSRQGELVAIEVGHGRTKLLHREMVEGLEARVLTVLARLHAEFPLMSTHDRQKVQSQLDYVGDEALVHAEVDRLLAEGRLIGDLRRLGRSDFKPKLSAALRKLKERVVTAYADGRFQPPEPGAFINHAGGNAEHLKDLFDVCVAEGQLVRVAEDLYLHGDMEIEMRRAVEERLSQGGPGLTVAEIRDLLGTTRKYAVP